MNKRLKRNAALFWRLALLEVLAMNKSRLLWSLSLGHSVEHWYEAAFWLFLPVFAAALGLSFVQVGMLATARSFLSAIMHVLMGAISDVLGRPLLLLTGCLAWLAVGFFAMGLAPSYLSLLLLCGAFGAAVGLWHPPAMAILSRVFPERRGFALSAHELAGNVGNLVAPVLIGLALAAFSWQVVMTAHLVPGLLVALLFWLGMPRLTSTADRRAQTAEGHASAGPAPLPTGAGDRLTAYRQVVGALLANPTVLALSAVSALRTAAQSSLSAFLPLYLAFAHGLGPELVGLYLSALFALGTVSPLLGGIASDRLGRRPVLLVGLFAAGLLSLALPLAAPGPLLISLLAATGLFLYSLRSVIFAYALDVSDAAGAASTVGFIFGVQGVVAGLAPAALGALADLAGPASALAAAGGLTLAGGVLVLALPRPRVGRTAV